MCKIMQEYEDKARDEGREEGIKEGVKKGMLEGREEGRKEGKLLGAVEALRSLVNSGVITVSMAAQQCGMTEEAFLQTSLTA